MTRGLIHRHGPTFLKRMVWDREFAHGRWDFLNRPDGVCGQPDVERHARGGAILDVGCGPASTGHELTHGTYSLYTGVDISQVAIDMARARLARQPAPHTYECADMLTYVPRRQFDVILFGDSLYYIALPQVPALLRRYAQFLTPGGSLIVRVCDSDGRYQPLLSVVREQFTVVESSRRINDDALPVELIVFH